MAQKKEMSQPDYNTKVEGIDIRAFALGRLGSGASSTFALLGYNLFPYG